MTTSRRKAFQREAHGLPNKLPPSRQSRLAHGAAPGEPELREVGKHRKPAGARMGNTVAARVSHATRSPSKPRGSAARKRAQAKTANVRGEYSTPNPLNVTNDKQSRARATGRRNKLTAQTAALRKAG